MCGEPGCDGVPDVILKDTHVNCLVAFCVRHRDKWIEKEHMEFVRE